MRDALLDSVSSLIWVGDNNTNQRRLWSSMQNPCTERDVVVFLCCFVYDMEWRQQDKLRGELWSSMQKIQERRHVKSNFLGLTTARQMLETFCTAVLMSLIQG